MEKLIKEMESQIRREKSEFTNMKRRHDQTELRLKENREKLKMCTQLPHMIANIGEILEPEEEEDGDKDGSGFNVEKVPGGKKNQTKQKPVVVKTTGRHTVYLPVPGMVEADELKPGELVAVNKESFIIYEKLPAEYNSRVMALGYG